MWCADIANMLPLILVSNFINKKYLTSLMLTICISVPASAGTNKISCDMMANQQTFGALPDFKKDSSPLLGFSCQTAPYISSYLGNWFPSLPAINYSQSKRTKKGIDDINQKWGVSLSIKRIHQGQLYIFANQNLSKSTLEANDDIYFIPKDLSNTALAISVNQKQNVRLSHQKDSWGVGLQFPYIENQPLTKVLFRRSVIDQPMQANIQGFPKHSLYEAKTQLSEIEIGNQSFDRGFNINWKIAMGLGEIELEPTALTSVALDIEQDKIISLSSEIGVYYQHRINRRWFAYTRGVGEIQYWHQSTKDKNFELENYRWIAYQAHIGLGMSF